MRKAAMGLAAAFSVLHAGAGAQVPGPWRVQTATDANLFNTSTAAADFNRDGLADLFLANSDLVGSFGGPRPLTNLVIFNNGTSNPFAGSPTVVPSTEASLSSKVIILDVNRDGRPDVVEANGNPQVTAGAFNRLYINMANDGRTWQAVNVGITAAEKRMSICVAPGDIDGDGDIDLAFGNTGLPSFFVPYQPVRFYRNDGTGLAYIGADIAESAGFSAYAIAMADLDGDGDIDIVTGNGDLIDSSRSRQVDRVYLNNGGGTPWTAAWTGHNLTEHAALTAGVAVGDLNGDGKADVITTSWGRDLPEDRNRIYFGDGTGTNWEGIDFPYTPNLDSRFCTAVRLHDFDGDTDLDALISADGRTIVYLNDGTGRNWTRHYISPVSYTSFDNLLADLDGDSDLDFATANYTDAGQAFFNDGREIDVPLAAIDFGSLALDAPAPTLRTVTISNVGGGALSFTGAGLAIQGADAADFRLVNVDKRPIPARGSRVVTIAFDPIFAGPKDASLAILTNDANEASLSVPLGGEGLVGPTTDGDGDGFTDLIEIEYASDQRDPQSRPPFLDADGDGKATLVDALALARLLGGTPLDPYDADLDADRDGDVDADDVQILFRWATGDRAYPVVPKVAAP